MFWVFNFLEHFLCYHITPGFACLLPVGGQLVAAGGSSRAPAPQTLATATDDTQSTSVSQQELIDILKQVRFQ